MTQLEFLKELKKYAPLVQWNLYRGGELRTLNGEHCPITWVGHKKIESHYGHALPFTVGTMMGMDEEVITDIVMAADIRFDHIATDSVEKLRIQLIKITKPLQTVDV